MSRSIRIMLKIILFPVRLGLNVFTRAMSFILDNAITIRIFSTVSGLLFIGFLAMTWSAIFVSHNMSLTARILIPCLTLLASYIACPFTGALKYLRLLIERIEDFNELMKEI